MKKNLITTLLSGILSCGIIAGCTNSSSTVPTTANEVTDTTTGEETSEETSETDNSQGEEPAEENANMENPWRKCTVYAAKEACPRMFKIPDGAEDESWFIMDSAADETAGIGPMIQADFTMNGMAFTARAQYGVAEETDISGMYYDWTSSENVTLANWGDGNMKGSVCRYAGDGEMADLCTWYDIEVGISYSLSVVSDDLDGFDIQAVAESMYEKQFEFGSYDQFEVFSDDLLGEAWDPIISNKSDGQNMSPELHWDPVEGADRYYIFMVDETAGNWLHWQILGLSDSSIAQGACDKELSIIADSDGREVMGQYVGPYPPSGTHTYTVYVFAVKGEPVPDNVLFFDKGGNDIIKIAKMLNTAEGTDEDNLISYGMISGTYTAE